MGDQSGDLKEVSPQLQDSVGQELGGSLDEKADIINLCNYAGTGGERARLEDFLALAHASLHAHNQASKLHCSLRRRGPTSDDLVDVCMYAAV